MPAPTDADIEKFAVNSDLSDSAIIRPYDFRLLLPENVLALNDQIEYERVDVWASQIAPKLNCSAAENVRIITFD